MKSWYTTFPTLVIGLLGFGLGKVANSFKTPKTAPLCLENTYQEISIVQLKELTGDVLTIDLNGPVRLVWNDDFVEGEGEKNVPLGQIKNKKDKDFWNFAYAGNAGTMKFYPSDTYAARGTHPTKRRFFETKDQAVAAGFKASKLVK